ncbi:MAG TPA: ABC transporter substrate-binding protein [Spirillospora sp.]|nr:ABC transporter substrate-binding protein [Spirillospora sp.]
MRNTRIIVLVLAAVLALALTGIGTAQDEVQLTLAGWSSHPAEDAALRAALDLFMEENPGVTVEFIPSPDHTLTMQTAFASGDYAEVFYIDSSVLPNWVDAGVVAPAEGMIEDVEGLYPALVDIFTIDDVFYCPPKDFSTMALQYNKDLFDAAGLDYPTPDWTWDDLRAAAEALTDPDAGIIGLVTPPELPRWMPFMYQSGGAIFDDEGNYVFDSPETRAALEFYIGMVRDGIAGSFSLVDAGWGGEAFGEGRAAMAMEGNWVIQFLLESYPELNWGVTELPAGPAGKATMAFTVCYGVAAKNDHPEESWALVNFLTGPTGAQFVAESSFGPMPTRPAAADAYLETWGSRAEGTLFDPADIQAFVTGADYSHRWQLPVGWNQFTDTFNASIQRAFDGQMTVDDLIFEVGLVAEELGGM